MCGVGYLFLRSFFRQRGGGKKGLKYDAKTTWYFRDGGSLHLFSFLCHDISGEEERVFFAPFDGASDGGDLSPSLQLAKQFRFPGKVHRRKIGNCCSKKV